MDDIEKLQAEIAQLKTENELLKKQSSETITSSKIITQNAEKIITKAINLAYDIRVQLKNMLESLRGKKYEEGIKVIAEFVSNNKYFLGSDLKESEKAAKKFIDQVINDLKEKSTL